MDHVDNNAAMEIVHDDEYSSNSTKHRVEPKQKMEPARSDCGSSYPAFRRLRLKRKYEADDGDEESSSSSYLSENDDEEDYDDFYKPARRNANAKRNRIEKRNKINKKMRALRELIPNCKKAIDNVSMLDEAIGYTKALQVQAQVMSMGIMSEMMLNVRMQQMLAAHLLHFSPWSPEMDLRADTGVNYNQTHFPGCPGLNQENGLPVVGSLGQGITMALPSPQLIPFQGDAYAQSVPLGNVYEATHIIDEKVHKPEYCFPV